MAAVNYSVPGVVPAMAQPTPKTCWATVVAVMTAWRTGVSTEIRTVLAGVGAKWVEMFDQDRGLTTALAPALYADAGFVTLGSFNPTIEGWESLLRQFGPLYVDVGYDTGATTHAIIVTAIAGDGTAAGTSITYLDPIPGTMATDRFDAFLRKYEATSAVQWPYTIVHWPAGVSVQSSLTIRHSYSYVNPSRVVRTASLYAVQQNPAALVIAGIEVVDAAQIGLAAISVGQAAGSATSGTFVLTYPVAQRLLASEARLKMPGAQTAKQAYSRHLFYLGIGAINAAEADVIIEWDGNPYGEIATPIIRKKLDTSTDWSRSAATIAIVKRDGIPLPNTDPRTWPIVYSYEGSYDPYGNGLFEFTGEFEINAFGGLKFNRHEVVSRSAADFAIGGTPYDKVQHGADNIVPVPEIPQEQIEYLKTRLP
jgi:hypothetical protein